MYSAHKFIDFIYFVLANLFFFFNFLKNYFDPSLGMYLTKKKLNTIKGAVINVQIFSTKIDRTMKLFVRLYRPISAFKHPTHVSGSYSWHFDKDDHHEAMWQALCIFEEKTGEKPQAPRREKGAPSDMSTLFILYYNCRQQGCNGSVCT